MTSREEEKERRREERRRFEERIGTEFVQPEPKTAPTPEFLGRFAYKHYGAKTNYLNYQGLPMPTWEDLPEQIQGAWIAAAANVYGMVTAQLFNAEVLLAQIRQGEHSLPGTLEQIDRYFDLV